MYLYGPLWTLKAEVHLSSVPSDSTPWLWAHPLSGQAPPSQTPVVAVLFAAWHRKCRGASTGGTRHQSNWALSVKDLWHCSHFTLFKIDFYPVFPSDSFLTNCHKLHRCTFDELVDRVTSIGRSVSLAWGPPEANHAPRRSCQSESMPTASPDAWHRIHASCLSSCSTNALSKRARCAWLIGWRLWWFILRVVDIHISSTSYCNSSSMHFVLRSFHIFSPYFPSFLAFCMGVWL